jgi:membrane associated rhomboid family serine protease
MVQGGPFWGLLTAPFSHAGFGHLISNSLWFLPLSWLVLLRGSRDYLGVWLAVLVLEIPVWLFWPSASHGLSGVNYGLLGYLLLIGWLEKRPLTMVLSTGCLLAYGGLLLALLPFLSPPGVSWIGHASGFVAGLLATMVAGGRAGASRSQTIPSPNSPTQRSSQPCQGLRPESLLP